MSWSDLTQNLTNPNSPESDQNVFSRYGVSPIAIDPDSDPDYIDQMVVYAGIAGVPEQDGFERVFKSTNGGQTWVDISAGLPGFPVNYLACQPGSGGVVYAATDVGVFVYKPDLGQWECFNADLPISIVTGLEVNMCTGKLYASTYGRSIWQTDLYFPPSLPLRVISATTSIGDIITAQTVRVAAGSTLTINGTWEFRPRASLIIEQGAKVIVDGGTLTSRCPTFWCGVQVWGTTDQHQSPESHPTCQGPLVLKNGALVENAHEAFTNWKPGDWNTRGGVIQVQGTPASTGATFRNCRRSAGFMAYQNFLSSNPAIKLNDASYFNYARFLWDDACFNGINTYAHVTLWGVNGLRFRACSFENNQLTTPAHTSSKLGKGIYSEDASYSVTGKCQQLMQLGMPCPEQYLDRSHFIGLDHGISALGAGGSRSFTVLHSDFDDNICGVYANGVLSYQVQNNRFRMGGRTVPLDGLVDARFQGRHRALFSTESWAFAVDDNTVEQDGAYTLTEGIVIGYSRDHNDIVSRNQATGLERGFIGEGIAADLTPGYTGLRGLQFLCNTNSNNTQDSWSRLVTDDDQLLQPFHTIRTNQGNSYRPADYTFDQVPGPEGVGDFKVTTENGNIT